MKRTRTRPGKTALSQERPRPDRLTQGLVGIAFVLTAVLAAIGADLLQQRSTAAVAEAAPPPTAAPDLVPLPSPTVAISLTAPVSETVMAAIAVTPPPCVPPDDWGIHVVQEGNTLYSLARRYGTDVATLSYVNCLNTDTIFIGQRLYVPGAAETPPVAPVSTLAPAAATALAGSAAGGDRTPTPVAKAVPTSPSALRLQIPDTYLNIVLLGSDKRPSSGAWRTDSMIIVSVDTERNVVRLLSLPRDLWVYIPGHGNNRINTADLWGELARKGGGPERVKQTIYHNLGIPIHYYVRVDFQGFIKIIDTVGGVDIDVDCPLPDIQLTAGMHHMSGQQALRYARSRKSTNDFDRSRRQRKVLMALWEQGLSLDLIPKLPILWRTMTDSFQTDLPLSQVINLAYVGTQLKPQRILSQAIGPSMVEGWMTPEGAAVLLPRQDRIRAFLESFYAPKDLSGLDSTAKMRVRILNGSTRREADQLAAAAVRWEGFKVTSGGLADRQDYAQTQVLVYNGDLEAGARLAGQLAVPATAVQDRTGTEQPDPSNLVEILVILGRDYDPCQR